jgi:hypothetical protein
MANKLFEVDYWCLGNLEALRYIVQKEAVNQVISIRTVSFTPLNYSTLMMSNKNKKLFSINRTGDLKKDETILI